jgi:hypothetical protein
MKISEQTEYLLKLKRTDTASVILGLMCVVGGTAAYFQPKGMLTGVILVICGIIAIAKADFGSVVFNKTTQVVEIRRKSIFLRKYLSYSLKDIKEVILETNYPVSTGDKHQRPMSQLLLIVGEEKVALTAMQSATNINGIATSTPISYIAKAIADFLNVPLIQKSN